MKKHAFLLHSFIVTIITITLSSCSQVKHSSHETITTTETINSIEKALEPGCLIASDFDNTLFEPVNEHEGSEQWFSACMEYLAKTTKLSSKECSDALLPIYKEVHTTAQIKPVEDTTMPLLKRFLAEKNTVIVITARSIINQTFRQLKDLNFSFEKFHLAQDNITLTLSKGPAYYQKGMLFCGYNDKGEALSTLIEILNLKPSKVIFIDDKKHHVESVERAMNKKQIPYTGFRYARLDAKVSNYHLPQEHIKSLDQIVADQSAKKQKKEQDLKKQPLLNKK